MYLGLRKRVFFRKGRGFAIDGWLISLFVKAGVLDVFGTIRADKFVFCYGNSYFSICFCNFCKNAWRFCRLWGDDQFSCLDNLWTRESQWNYQAKNPSSGAYGIPQALPGSKMGSVASDWATNPTTQITWGLGYIKGRYGTPCSAWAHSQSTGWY